MSGRGCLAALFGVAAIVAMVVLLCPVSIEVHSYGAVETVSCGMPVGPRLERVAELDHANGGATDYHGRCADKLDKRRMWAIPIGAVSFVLALGAAAARLGKRPVSDRHKR